MHSAVSWWLNIAKEDLTAAKLFIASTPEHPRTACYQAYSAAEAALKALLAVNNISSKLRDLRTLAAMLPEHDESLFTNIDLKKLTRWRIEGRYPIEGKEATTSDAVIAIGIAMITINIVKDRIENSRFNSFH
jgi:HEPN domain-containing protein